MPAVFKERGYATYFYYGANKDHYGLEKFSRKMGVDHYISGEDYKQAGEHNGYWGINDSAFFQFTVEQMNVQPQPFFTTVFNLSSHYPYVIPKQYRNSFPKGNTAAAQSISFVDRALQRFFEQAQKARWYENTVFVFVGDHWNKEDLTVKAEGSGCYQIPLFIYKPDGSLKKNYAEVTDQVSIFPTMMQLTGYEHKFTSFGKSMFDSTGNRFAVAVKQWPSLLLFTDKQSELYFDVNSGKVNSVQSFTGEKIKTSPEEERRAQSFVQYYNYLFTANKLADTSHTIH
jgi:phosphoglycerol transferase MdoB-like AlkP superfamily enzyme